MNILERIVQWTELKCRIQVGPEKPLYFDEREIWWASIGVNIGSEQNGKHELFERPVLILKKFNERLLWVIPATSKNHEGRHYYSSSSSDWPQTLILSQMRAMSPKRLIRKQRSMPKPEFEQLREKIRILI